MIGFNVFVLLNLKVFAFLVKIKFFGKEFEGFCFVVVVLLAMVFGFNLFVLFNLFDWINFLFSYLCGRKLKSFLVKAFY